MANPRREIEWSQLERYKEWYREKREDAVNRLSINEAQRRLFARKRGTKGPSLRFPVVIQPISRKKAGGFAAIVPDLPGFASLGDRPGEALSNVQDAIQAWIEQAKSLGRAIPRPSRDLTAALKPPTRSAAGKGRL